MARQEIHTARKSLLAMGGYEEEVQLWLREMLIILECMDWKKKEKSFTNMAHYVNWLKATTEIYGLREGALEIACHELVNLGVLDRIKRKNGTLALALPEVPEDGGEE